MFSIALPCPLSLRPDHPTSAMTKKIDFSSTRPGAKRDLGCAKTQKIPRNVRQIKNFFLPQSYNRISLISKQRTARIFQPVRLKSPL